MTCGGMKMYTDLDFELFNIELWGYSSTCFFVGFLEQRTPTNRKSLFDLSQSCGIESSLAVFTALLV